MQLRRFNDVEYSEPAREADAKSLQKRLGVRFPESLQQFLHDSDGAAFMEEAHRFEAKFATGQTVPRLEWIYSLEEIESKTATFQGTSAHDESHPAIAMGMIVIGSAVDDTDQGPVILDLRPDAPVHGAVYFRHLTFSPDQAGVPWEEALAFVAPSFGDLLAALHDPEA